MAIKHSQHLGYQSYQRYKTVLELLQQRPSSVNELIKKTKIPRVTLERMMRELITNEVVLIVRFSTPYKERIFGVKPNDCP